MGLLMKMAAVSINAGSKLNIWMSTSRQGAWDGGCSSVPGQRKREGEGEGRKTEGGRDKERNG